MLDEESIILELETLGQLEGLLGSAIVNRNGILLACWLPRSIDDRKFGAMSAFLFGASEMAARELNSNVINFIVEYERSQVLILEIDETYLIVCLLELDANLGLILIEIEESIINIKKLIQSVELN